MNDYYKTPEIIDAELAVAFSERKALRNSIIMLAVILVILLVTLYVLIRANTVLFPKHEVVYTANAAAVCSFVPVNERGPITDAIIENYASEISRELHLLDYVNYRSTLARVTDGNFTEEARAETVRAMLSSSILEAVAEQGFVLRALPGDRPAILSQGVENGTYTWVVRVPIVLAYAYRGEGNNPNYRPENRNIYMTIIRTQPTATNPLGLLVSKLLSLQPTDQFNLEKFKSESVPETPEPTPDMPQAPSNSQGEADLSATTAPAAPAGAEQNFQ